MTVRIDCCDEECHHLVGDLLAVTATNIGDRWWIAINRTYSANDPIRLAPTAALDQQSHGGIAVEPVLQQPLSMIRSSSDCADLLLVGIASGKHYSLSVALFDDHLDFDLAELWSRQASATYTRFACQLQTFCNIRANPSGLLILNNKGNQIWELHARRWQYPGPVEIPSPIEWNAENQMFLMWPGDGINGFRPKLLFRYGFRINAFA